MEASFDKQGSCTISFRDRYYDDFTFVPKVIFHKGQKKSDINTRLISSLAESVVSTKAQLRKVLEDIEQRYNDYKKQLDTPFATPEEVDVALNGIRTQIEQVKLRISDCDRLESLCL
jgi:MoxR-like ATPase